MTEEEIMLVFPQQRNRFSVIHNVFDDLYDGFERHHVRAEVIEVENKSLGKSMYDPGFEVKRMRLEELIPLIEEGKTFVTIDDFNLLYEFHRLKTNLEGGLIWAQYFYGHRYIFSQYREWDQPNGICEYLLDKVSAYVPSKLSLRLAGFYIETLRRSNLIAQSLWTALLLNRVYNLGCKGVVYLPINPKFYDFNLETERDNKALIFFSGKSDTNLKELLNILRIVRIENPKLELHGFGDKELCDQFKEKYHIDIEFHSNIERRELSALYNSCLFTINPVYNGTFENVPIESLLVGTPVITYLQPFLEVAGESELVANIQNAGEIRSKLVKWKMTNLCDERRLIKEKILFAMNSVNVAKNIKQMLEYVI